ncbi:hypothetical protein KKG66_07030, partial [bacterium]|nr:hypothetical protein [bacterium]
QAVIVSDMSFPDVVKEIEKKYDTKLSKHGESSIGGLQWLWAKGDGSPIAIIWSNSRTESTTVTMFGNDEYFK